MTDIQEQSDREMAFQLQQSYESEYNLADATNALYLMEGAPPLPRTSQSVALEVMSSMISMPYSISPTSSAGIQFRGSDSHRSSLAVDSRRSSMNNSRRSSGAPGMMERYSGSEPGPLPPTSPSQTQTQQETNRRTASIFRKDRPEASQPPVNDFILARALQAMEFEIADETLLNRNTRDATTTDDRFENK